VLHEPLDITIVTTWCFDAEIESGHLPGDRMPKFVYSPGHDPAKQHENGNRQSRIHVYLTGIRI